nr:MAG TPA: Selenoprotein S (SelS) [Caudoviricetes sp.]
MKFIVTLSDMVGVVLIALLVFVWIIFGMIILVNIVKDNIKYRIDKWKREREVMKEWERINDGETDRKNR